MAWMAEFGELIDLAENVRDPLRVESVPLYSSKGSEDFKDHLSTLPEPLHSAATNVATS